MDYGKAPSHEAFGFALVGVYREIGYKLGAWHDVAWYEAEAQPVTADPPAPRSIAVLKGSAAGDAAVAKGLAHYVNHS